MAWATSAGFRAGSSTNTCDAAVRVSPVEPERIERMKTLASDCLKRARAWKGRQTKEMKQLEDKKKGSEAGSKRRDRPDLAAFCS